MQRSKKTIQPSHITVKWQNMKKEKKIYRVQLVLNDTIKSYENDEVNVFQTENEQEAKRIFEKLSENKNLKYILRWEEVKDKAQDAQRKTAGYYSKEYPLNITMR